MLYKVAPDAFDKHPDFYCGFIVAFGVTKDERSNSVVGQLLRAKIREAESNPGIDQSHPRIKSGRKFTLYLGGSGNKFVSSVRNFVKCICKVRGMAAHSFHRLSSSQA